MTDIGDFSSSFRLYRFDVCFRHCIAVAVVAAARISDLWFDCVMNDELTKQKSAKSQPASQPAIQQRELIIIYHRFHFVTMQQHAVICCVVSARIRLIIISSYTTFSICCLILTWLMSYMSIDGMMCDVLWSANVRTSERSRARMHAPFTRVYVFRSVCWCISLIH